MPWKAFQMLLMCVVLLSTGVVLVSGAAVTVRPLSLRLIMTLHGMAVGGLLVSSLIKLGVIKL